MGMNISGASSSSALEYVKKLGSATSSSSTSSTSETESDLGSEVKLSKPAEMLKKLAALQESDPAKFKQVVTDIADKLNEAAQTASGEQATRLSDMASKFSAAAESGDLSSLKPPSGGGQGHGPGGAHGPGGPRGAGGPPPPPKSESDDDSSSDDSTSSSSTSSYAIAAYKKQQQTDSVFKSAMDSAFSTVDDATKDLDV